MKDNMKDFRETSNTFLKDIYVTEDLKRKTLEKCTDKRVLKMSPLIASTVSAALLISTFGIYNYFLHKPTIANNSANNSINHEYKNFVYNNDSKDPTKISETQNLDNSKSVALNNEPNTGNENSAVHSKNSDTSVVTKDANTAIEALNDSSLSRADNSQNISIPQNEDSNISATNSNVDVVSQNTNNTTESSDNILQNKMSNEQNKDMYLSSEVPTASISLPESLNMASAEKYFGSDILLPTSIPEGFNLTAISIPDDKLKCVKLNYNSNTTYFEILQNKNLSKLQGDKIIYIKDNKAYVTSTKDDQSNIVTTKITWMMNNIEYSLCGNLPENSLINIAKSIN